MADPKSLYQEVILDHNRKPRNFGTLENASHSATGHNPLCGDHIGLALRLNGDAIEGIAFHGEACAICKASACCTAKRRCLRKCSRSRAAAT